MCHIHNCTGIANKVLMLIHVRIKSVHKECIVIGNARTKYKCISCSIKIHEHILQFVSIYTIYMNILSNIMPPP